MKLDIEGAELLVLKGATRTIEANHPVMVIEIHDFEGSSDDSLMVLQLSEWGYRRAGLTEELTSHLLAH